MGKKLQVFVSSTYLDLIEERQKAVEGILRAKHIPAGMELFVPSNKTQWSIIEEWIKDSDLLLLILGGKYGSIEPDSGKSYTQLEYEYALLNKIPVFSIVLNKQFLANKKSRNVGLEIYEHEVTNPFLENYNSFKRTVMSNYISEVEDINQISTEVSLALQEFINRDSTEYYFRGWIRGEERIDSVKLQLDYNIKCFLEDKKRQGRVSRTLDTYRTDLRIFQEFFDEKIISEIKTADIKDFLIYREDNFPINSKRSMERIRGNLNVFFDWMIEEKIVQKNPVRKINPYKFNKRGNQALSEIELSELREGCKTLRERAILEVLLSTGCHLSELNRINLNNIDWTNKTLVIIDSREKERVVFLTPIAEIHLKKYLDERTDTLKNIFVTQRKPYRSLSNKAIQDEMSNIARRTTITKNISPRIFRETFSRFMSDRGYQSHIVESLLGYDAKTTRSETYFIITNNNIWDILRNRPEF